MKRSAFTMIELVLVIVVLGILAALALPRFERDIKQEAADSVLSDIRYTQHLALMSSKHKFDEPKWQRAFWKISFEPCSDNGLFTNIGTDVGYDGDISETESAMDPVNGKIMYWDNSTNCADGGDSNTSDRIFLTKKFGIKAIAGANGCAGVQDIGFDHLGRPHVSFSGSTAPTYGSYMNTACTFTFTMSDDDTFSIQINPETGYAFIVGQLDS
ncbi:Tfp pilus assembly protein FimT/FimU [Sulfurovum sp. AR]|uniref:pilus assembly FimT family protein n=1 Tax=Sulfurovum sp. AR TaxID=1165841 RepID=UPI00025C4B32|nr:type II secretion system protein [Sulfurovum sp. AR]EIF50969.1 hypothetical protein SULAR_06358 [Sulfurovum sp. AR]